VAGRQSVEDDFREFVAARSPALLRTAYLLTGDWATAEDLLQTALTKIFLAWKRLGEIEAVEPYARRVLVNTSISWWRRRWHGERPTEVLPERAAPDRVDEQLERDALWQHVKSLPARQRAVLVLRFYEDLSEAQTASLLGISTGTVKSQTSRALNTLRQRLGAERLAAEQARAAELGEARTGRPVPAPRPYPAVEELPAEHLPADEMYGAALRAEAFTGFTPGITRRTAEAELTAQAELRAEGR
jgi:RNA polymerase sigma-70 factor (sigma-E family)